MEEAKEGPLAISKKIETKDSPNFLLNVGMMSSCCEASGYVVGFDSWLILMSKETK